MSDIDPTAFLNGLSDDQKAAFAAAFFAAAPTAITTHLAGSAAAQALVKTVVKPKRVSSRGPSFWDLLLADPAVLEAMGEHLECEASNVWGAIQARLEKASVTGTFDRKDENGVIHKMRVICIDETAKTASSVQKKIDAIAEASNEKALTDAVEAATKALASARALPAPRKASLEEAIVATRDARASSITAATVAPPAPPA